jgi:FkbM family methyltransferase
MARIPTQLRPYVVRAARSRPARAIFRTIYGLQYGRLAGSRRFDSFACWLATRDPQSPAERTRSVAETEQLFLSLVETLRPVLFVEAGAKDAGISAKVKAMLPGTRAVAFEANPYTHGRFRDRHADGATGVEYLNLALSSGVSDVTMFVRRRPDGTPSADGRGSLLRNAAYQPGHLEVTVPATTLDAFFADRPGVACALWIDVEGAAHLVLDGAHRLLAGAQLLIVEVEERPVWSGQHVRRDVVARLRDLGFVPVARDFQSRFQFNLILMPRQLRRSPGVAALI